MSRVRLCLHLSAVVGLLCLRTTGVLGQDDLSAAGKAIYDDVRRFALSGGAIEVNNLLLKRDRVEMTFTGTFYLSAPASGQTTGAVFLGQGQMRAAVPPSEFERDNVKRLLNADVVESDFKTAVLKFADDTLKMLDGKRTQATAPEQAQKLADEFEPRFLRETGANISARVAASLIDQVPSAIFFAQFDGGRRGRFTYLFDPQGWIPVANFNINGGEQGLIFTHEGALRFNEVWLAFYGMADYERGTASYSDVHDLVDISSYTMDLDLRQFDKRIALTGKMEMTARRGGARAIPFKIGESLPTTRDIRLKQQMRASAVRVGGKPAAFVQEDWEGGLTVFLPQPTQTGQALSIDVEFAGDFMERVTEFAYPVSNTSWYPRHGYLDRSTFDLTFRHRTREKVASVGTRVSEQADAADREVTITRYQMKEPVALAVFALGPYERKTQQVKWEAGGAAIPLEVNSVPARVTYVKADFVMAELDNAVRYFAAMFGAYPYPTFGAAFHPFGFGQGFPTMLMVPPVSTEGKGTYSFFAHETAHQWWGNIVAWRSYRDQWLSEGFAEYSGMLYASLREKQRPNTMNEMLDASRRALVDPPRTALGVGRGRLNDIGPIILGFRLNTTESAGAYQTLIYQKGALVLRMLHFLMSNPTTADDKAFSTMMTDFVERHRNKSASTDEFRLVANDHFSRTPIAQKHGLANLNWFFRQWVYQTGLPTYQMEYSLADHPNGGVRVTGTIRQENVAADFMMPMPILFSFDGNREGRTTVLARGPSTAFELSLPQRPKKVELDPYKWVLSEKTESRGK